MAIFAKYQNFPEKKEYLDKLLELILKNLDNLTIEKIEEIRTVYEEYLQILVNKNIITIDDFQTYKEIYPLYNAFYVSYDKDEEYEDLKQVYQRILSPKVNSEH